MKFQSSLLFSLGLSLCLISPVATAQNIYINDMSLKSDLDWLNSQGVIQINTSTWPMTANEIKRTLTSAHVQTAAQVKVLNSIKSTLHMAPQRRVNTQAKLYLQTDREGLPQTFADNQTATAQGSYQVGFSDSNWEVSFQANVKHDDIIDGDDISFDGTYLAGNYANQWLIAGQIPTWWGPGHDGSLIRGDASLPVAGLTMQRDNQSAPTSRYLSWVGPWQYQVFAGKLDEYEAVPNTKLIGMRLTANPKPWLQLGASRSIMWGGDGRPESLSSLSDALLGTRDNGGTGDPDPANQLAGFDARLNLKSLTNMPVGIYAQYTGEDEAGGLPAKNMYLAGIDYASSLKSINGHNDMPYLVYAEYTDTRSSGEVRGISYDHSNYTDGYYQRGYPLGYALGGDAESTTIGGKLWLNNQNFINAKLQYAKVNQSEELDSRTGKPDNHAYPQSDKIKVIDVAWEHQYNPKMMISSRLWAVDSDIKSTDVGVGVGVTFNNH